MPKPLTVKVYLQDGQVWDRAKVQATRQGLSLSKVVALLLEAYVSGDIVVNAANVGGRNAG